MVTKHKFDGISKFSATMIFTQIASSNFSFMTVGLLGKFTYFALTKFCNFMANRGLIIANVGVDFVSTHFQKETFDETIEEAIKKVKESKGKLTDEEKAHIDKQVKDAFRDFISFVN